MKFQISNFKFQIFKEGGFTLLEVMIALSIVAGIVITALMSLNYQLGVINDNSDIIVATVLGKERMKEINLSALPEKREGNFGEPFTKFSYQLNLEDTQLKSLKRVEMKVLWGKGREVSIASYKIKK